MIIFINREIIRRLMSIFNRKPEEPDPTTGRLERCVRLAFSTYSRIQPLDIGLTQVDLNNPRKGGVPATEQHPHFRGSPDIGRRVNSLKDQGACTLLYRPSSPETDYAFLVGARVARLRDLNSYLLGSVPIKFEGNGAGQEGEDAPFRDASSHLTVLLSAYSFRKGNIVPAGDIDFEAFRHGVSTHVLVGGNHTPFAYLARSAAQSRDASTVLLCVGNDPFETLCDRLEVENRDLRRYHTIAQQVMHKALDPALSALAEATKTRSRTSGSPEPATVGLIA